MDDEKKGFRTELETQLVKSKENLSKLSENTSFRTKAVIHMAAMGYSTKQIAAQMNVTASRISNILNSTGAKAEVERIQQEMFYNGPKEAFKAMLPKAVKTVRRLMNKDEKGSVQLGAAKEVFERSWGKAVQPVEVGGSAIKDLLMALDSNRRKIEDKPSNGDAIEADFRELPKDESSPPKDELDSWLDDHFD